MPHDTWQLGRLTVQNRLIQAPLAGYSCAPFRRLFYQFVAPGYCVTEMISATDVINKHRPDGRYLYRCPSETCLAYQLSGTEPDILAQAAILCEAAGADVIDINCGCPKAKIRRKGAGSALLEKPDALMRIIEAVKQAISVPLTIKIRLVPDDETLILAKKIESAGADALIVHGRTHLQDYDSACDWHAIAAIKQAISIPVIANGDIADQNSLAQAMQISQCDAFMVGRAGTGRPWLYQQILTDMPDPSLQKRLALFFQHVQALACLEDDKKALLQSRSLWRYYFSKERQSLPESALFQANSLRKLHQQLEIWCIMMQNLLPG